MSEKLQVNNEQYDPKRLEQAGKEHAEALRVERERNAENSKETNLEKEKASQEIEKILAEKERSKEKLDTTSVEKEQRTLPRSTKQARKASYNKQMKTVRAEMSPIVRTFSKFIHAKPIEKTSEAIGSTIARPNAILSGSAAALIITAGLYFWAKYVGYPLSGFETIGAFIIGWLIGIIFDFTRIMITGKR